MSPRLNINKQNFIGSIHKFISAVFSSSLFVAFLYSSLPFFFDVISPVFRDHLAANPTNGSVERYKLSLRSSTGRSFRREHTFWY